MRGYYTGVGRAMYLLELLNKNNSPQYNKVRENKTVNAKQIGKI
jgi:hypothetical protein